MAPLVLGLWGAANHDVGEPHPAYIDPASGKLLAQAVLLLESDCDDTSFWQIPPQRPSDAGGIRISGFHIGGGAAPAAPRALGQGRQVTAKLDGKPPYEIAARCAGHPEQRAVIAGEQSRVAFAFAAVPASSQPAQAVIDAPSALNAAPPSATVDVARVQTPTAAPPGQPWAVVIGIAKYQDTGDTGFRNLLYADDDARAVAQTLGKLGWNESHVRTLINEQATERNIRIALESWLTKAGHDDLILLYWAGHGYPDPEDPDKVYFACYDTELAIPATGFRMDRVRGIIEERGARNVIVLADTCHAGKLITRGNRGMSVAGNVQSMMQRGEVPRGWVFMVGADTDREALEHSSWSNGAFTHCLLNALSGGADGFQSAGPQDGRVSLGELRAYLETDMPDETQKILGVAKHPVITTSSGDPGIWNLSLGP